MMTDDTITVEYALHVIAKMDCVYHTSVHKAQADGWLNPYNGRHFRVYGRKPGNHRIWRCYWQGYVPLTIGTVTGRAARR